MSTSSFGGHATLLVGVKGDILHNFWHASGWSRSARLACIPLFDPTHAAPPLAPASPGKADRDTAQKQPGCGEARRASHWARGSIYAVRALEGGAPRGARSVSAGIWAGFLGHFAATRLDHRAIGRLLSSTEVGQNRGTCAHPYLYQRPAAEAPADESAVSATSPSPFMIFAMNAASSA